jgi:hypothetical protein
LAVGLQAVQQSSNLGLRQQELGVVLRIGKEGRIQLFQRGVAAEGEICFAFPFCLNDEIVNVIPLFLAAIKSRTRDSKSMIRNVVTRASLTRDLTGVPSPEHNAGANQERDASFQAHDQCRRERCLGHPCGQVPS